MSTEDRRAFQLQVMNLGVRLDHLVRSSQIYPDDHPALDSALQAVCELVSQIVAERGVVTFAPAGGRCVVQGVAVRTPRSLRSPLTQLRSWLDERALGGLELRASLGPSSLIRTIRVIDEGATDDGPGPDAINLQLDAAGLRAIRVIAPRVVQGVATVSDPVLAQLRLYLRGVRAVQRLHERGMSPAVLIELSQLADAVVDLVEASPAQALALTEPRDMVPFSLRHPVHAALVATLLAARLGQARPVLVEVAVCALSADAGKADLDPQLRRNPAHLSPDQRAERDRHPLHATRQLLALPELHAPLRRRLLVCFEQNLGADRRGTPAVLRWGPLHPVSSLVGLATAWDEARSADRGASAPLDTLAELRERQPARHPAILLDHLEGLLRAHGA